MGHCILPKTSPDLWGISIFFYEPLSLQYTAIAAQIDADTAMQSNSFEHTDQRAIFSGFSWIPKSILSFSWVTFGRHKNLTQESAVGWNLHHVAWSLNFRSTLRRDNCWNSKRWCMLLLCMYYVIRGIAIVVWPLLAYFLQCRSKWFLSLKSILPNLPFHISWDNPCKAGVSSSPYP